ncbi:hypothetical protein ABVT39_001723 [Epinephelus coioides]
MPFVRLFDTSSLSWWKSEHHLLWNKILREHEKEVNSTGAALQQNIYFSASMTHLGHNVPQKVVELITNIVSTFLLIVLFYILQYLFDMNFVCSCMEGFHLSGGLYLFVPPAILTWIVEIIESFQPRRNFSRRHSLCQSSVCGYLAKLMISYVCLSYVWIATVLFDGDWYFCVMTNLNSSQIGLPCKDTLSFKENLTKAAYKSESLEIGFYVIGSLIGVWGFAEVTTAYCRRKMVRCCSNPLHYRVVYKNLLEEEVSRCLQEELTTIATKRAKAICAPHLQAIKKNELSFNNTSAGNDNVDDTVSEAWWKISASDFYLMGPKRQKDSQICSIQ